MQLILLYLVVLTKYFKKMKKLILVLFAFATANLTAQVAKSRYIKVDEGKEEQVYEAMKAKTQKYNQSAEKGAHYTFYIETGPRAGQLFRARIEQDMAAFDQNGMQLALLNDESSNDDEMLWGDVEEIKLYDEVTNQIISDETYDSLDDARLYDVLDDGVPDVPHSYDGMEEVQSVQLASHGKGQHGPQPGGHQGEEECHCSLHCSL